MAAILAALVVIALLAGCGGGATSGGTAGSSSGGSSGATGTGAKITVSEKNFAFSPAAAQAKVGDTIEFVNNDSVAHDVSIDGKDLGQQSPGQTVTWTATAAGSFPYSCLIHPSMTGQITVQ